MYLAGDPKRKGWGSEGFTLPPYSTWNPHGIHMDSRQFQVDSIHSIWNMFWLRSHSFWSFHSTFIPYGIHLEWSYSITFPSFHMECPYGIHMECLWNDDVDSTTIPWNGHGFQMDSITFHGITMDFIWNNEILMNSTEYI